MRLLDLFCGAGGTSEGYSRAGFDVVGVDINPQPNYPFEFIRADALAFLDSERSSGFAGVHASPPCQHDAAVTRWRGRASDHPDLVRATGVLLRKRSLPYVMENVREAVTAGKLRGDLVLCGTMFGLPIRRHRYFETNWVGLHLVPPCQHRPTDLPFEHKGERAYTDAMGCGWMTNREGREAIPPVYTEHIGHYLMVECEARRKVAA